MIAVHSVYLKGGDRLSTMKDVARVAGVSIATVSRVLAGTAAVTDSTQKKVLAAMEELQYRTAAPVRPVIRKESQLTAVCMENLTSPYYIDLLRGVEDVLSISNCSPLLFNLDNDDRAFAELTQALLSFRVASVLFIGCGDILSRADLEQFPELPAVILAENTPSAPHAFPGRGLRRCRLRRFGRGDTADGGRNGAVHSLRGVHSTGGRPGISGI